MIKLGILGSTNGTDLQAIFEAEKTKKLNAKVNVVISNNKNSYILCILYTYDSADEGLGLDA